MNVLIHMCLHVHVYLCVCTYLRNEAFSCDISHLARDFIFHNIVLFLHQKPANYHYKKYCNCNKLYYDINTYMYTCTCTYMYKKYMYIYVMYMYRVHVHIHVHVYSAVCIYNVLCLVLCDQLIFMTIGHPDFMPPMGPPRPGPFPPHGPPPPHGRHPHDIPMPPFAPPFPPGGSVSQIFPNAMSTVLLHMHITLQ